MFTIPYVCNFLRVNEIKSNKFHKYTSKVNKFQMFIVHANNKTSGLRVEPSKRVGCFRQTKFCYRSS